MSVKFSYRDLDNNKDINKTVTNIIYSKYMQGLNERQQELGAISNDSDTSLMEHEQTLTEPMSKAVLPPSKKRLAVPVGAAARNRLAVPVGAAARNRLAVPVGAAARNRLAVQSNYTEKKPVTLKKRITLTAPSKGTSVINEFVQQSQILDNELNQIISTFKMESVDEFYKGGTLEGGVIDPDMEGEIMRMSDGIRYADNQMGHRRKKLIAKETELAALPNDAAHAADVQLLTDEIDELKSDIATIESYRQKKITYLKEEKKKKDREDKEKARLAMQELQKLTEIMEYYENNHEWYINDFKNRLMTYTPRQKEFLFHQIFDYGIGQHKSEQDLIDAIETAFPLIPRISINENNAKTQEEKMEDVWETFKILKSMAKSDSAQFIQRIGPYNNLGPLEKQSIISILNDNNLFSNNELIDGLKENGYVIPYKRNAQKGQSHKLIISRKELIDAYINPEAFKDDVIKGINITNSLKIGQIIQNNKDTPTIIKKISNIINTLLPLAQSLYSTDFRGSNATTNDKLKQLYQDMRKKMYFLSTMSNTSTQFKKLTTDFNKLYDLTMNGIGMFTPSLNGGSISRQSSIFTYPTKVITNQPYLL